MVYDLLFAVILSVAQEAVNDSGGDIVVSEQTQFVIDRFLYWISLGITLSAAIGIGFQGIRWLRKKLAEDRAKDEKKLEAALDKHNKEMQEYVATIAAPAKERRDKDEYMLTELIKRVDHIEEQQQIQLQVVLQNQQTITEFIASQKRGGRPIKTKDSLSP